MPTEDFPYHLTDHAQRRMAEREISLEWIKRVVTSPQKTEPDDEDLQLTHALGVVPEYGNRVLRVIYNHTTNPWRIVSIHFDRSLKGKL